MSGLAAVLSAAADTRFGDFGCDAARVDRASFAASTRDRAAELADAGVLSAQRVLVVSGRGLDYWRDLVACWRLGAVVVPVDPKGKSVELAGLCGAQWTLHSDGGIAALATPEDTREDFDAQARAFEWAAILITSGSTGRPKGVPVSAGALLGNARATLDRVGLSERHRLAIAIQGHFTSAICHFLSSVVSGAGFECTDRQLMPSALTGFVDEAKANAFGGSPLQLAWLAEGSGAGTLSWLMSSGDRLSIALERRLVERFPHATIFAAYGLTEVAGRCAIRRVQPGVDEGSVGRPIDGITLRIAPTDTELAKPDAGGQIGEIIVAGSLLFGGYLGADSPGRLRQAEFPTGDLGWLDEHGTLTVVGRTDDVFKCAGQKVSLSVVVDALRSISGVLDAAAISEPHPLLGAVAIAFVVLAPNSRHSAGQLIAALRPRLPPSHLPHEVVFATSIPRTGSGKVDRHGLAALRSAALGSIQAPDRHPKTLP